MRSDTEIIELIRSIEKVIINNLKFESIAVYNFLQLEFQNIPVNDNHLFQFVYRSYYRLDNAGLTEEFKDAYFRIMEEHRKYKNIDPIEIAMSLFPYKRLKGDKSFQYSFATKMINTILPDYPLYDSEVVSVFGFNKYIPFEIEKKIKSYQEKQACIINTYSKITQDDSLKSTIQLFDLRFENSRLSTNKKLDFIIWSAGKTLKKEELQTKTDK